MNRHSTEKDTGDTSYVAGESNNIKPIGKSLLQKHGFWIRFLLHGILTYGAFALCSFSDEFGLTGSWHERLNELSSIPQIDLNAIFINCLIWEMLPRFMIAEPLANKRKMDRGNFFLEAYGIVCCFSIFILFILNITGQVADKSGFLVCGYILSALLNSAFLAFCYPYMTKVEFAMAFEKFQATSADSPDVE